MTEPKKNPRCSICNHPKAAEINSALVAGEPMRLIEERFKVAKSSLSRHRTNHTIANALQKTAIVPRRRRRRPTASKAAGESIDVQSDLRDLIADLKAEKEAARDAGQSATVATLSDKLLRALEMYEKNQGAFGTRDGDGGNKAKGLEALAEAISSGLRHLSETGYSMFYGQCPMPGPYGGTCIHSLRCPKHGEINPGDVVLRNLVLATTAEGEKPLF